MALFALRENGRLANAFENYQTPYSHARILSHSTGDGLDRRLFVLITHFIKSNLPPTGRENVATQLD